MTNREREILELIKKDPFISQNELSQLLGIERSSVSVHISNLIKKGLIKGKGYIINEAPYLVVIGGANMDILCTPDHALLLHDSNPGAITLSCGGVGRNIAENISILGMQVKLLSAVGNDVYGDTILKSTSGSGVDISAIKRLNDLSTSTYISILNEERDMVVAINDMKIAQSIDISYLQEYDSMIKHAGAIILDANLSEDILHYITTRYSELPIIVDVVSASKAPRIKGLYSKLFSLKCNRIEAETLLQADLSNETDIFNALQQFHDLGVKHPVITLGSEGVAFLGEEGPKRYQKSPKRIENANGAGDAFTAALSYALFHESSIEDAVIFATEAALITLESKQTVAHTMKQLTLTTKGRNL